MSTLARNIESQFQTAVPEVVGGPQVRPRWEVKNRFESVNRRSADVGVEFVNSGRGVATSESREFQIAAISLKFT